MPFSLLELNSPHEIKEFIRDRLISPNDTVSEYSTHEYQGAVLFPLIWDNGLQVLMIRRSESLRRNPGDMAFPGGVADLSDHDVIGVALRETYEELGIPSSEVDILGSLGPFVLAGGMLKAIAIVGWLSSRANPKPMTSETDFVVMIPLHAFLNPRKYFHLFLYWDSRADYVRFFDTRRYANHNVVWGMSARVIRNFLDYMVPDHGLPFEPITPLLPTELQPVDKE